jgi:predicted DNA-binding protein
MKKIYTPNVSIAIRLSIEDAERLSTLCEELAQNTSVVIKKALHLLYQEVKSNKPA